MELSQSVGKDTKFFRNMILKKLKRFCISINIRYFGGRKRKTNDTYDKKTIPTTNRNCTIFCGFTTAILRAQPRQNHLAKKYDVDINSQMQEKLMNTLRGIRDYLFRSKFNTQRPEPIPHVEQTDDYEVIEVN